jgi:hypothetical protein
VTDEEGIAWLKSLQNTQLAREAMLALDKKHNGLLEAVRMTRGKEEKPRRPFRDGVIQADQLPEGIPPTRLWFGLYPGSVVFLIGETGAGKSSLLYNLAIHIARNDPLWNVHFGAHRPLNVLYADPENAGNWKEGVGGVCAQKVDRINAGRPPTLRFHDWRDCDLMDTRTQEDLREYMREEQTEILLLDPIANIFGTKDENDNAEAAKQMKVLTAISRESGVCIILCHHVGKADMSNYGRGATARLAAADVGMVLRVRSDIEDADDDFTGELIPRDDVCRLQIVKNRWEGRASLYLKMTGEDQFQRVSQKEWKEAGSSKTLGGDTKGKDAVQKLYKAKEAIRAFMADGQARPTAWILEYLKQNEGIGEYSARPALKEMVDDRILVTFKEGQTVAYKLLDDGHSPKENHHHQEATDTKNPLDETFFDPPKMPYKDDDGGWETAQ